MEQMNRKAEALGIELRFGPKGATGRYHPLHKRTFGVLKSKGGAKQRHEFAQYHGKPCTREVGAELMLQSRTELSNSVAPAGWDYGAEISDDENPESSDEDFELSMATDTDDEAIAVLQAEICNGRKRKGR
jgi:hypothetical protein